MARLPQPGGDDGTWGSVLNDYLSQAHKQDGTLKDGSVNAAQLAAGAVTTNSIADNAITSAKLSSGAVTTNNVVDGAISENQLDTAVQAKLNALSSLDAQTLATLQGYWLVASDTPPTQTTKYGVPVLWLKPTGFLTGIPVLPVAPIWNDAGAYVDIPPNMTGIEYQDGNGTVLAQGTRVNASPGQAMMIKAVALPGYTLSATYVWTHTFVSNVFTLVASEAFSGPAAATIVGRFLDNAVPGATGGATKQWFALGPGVDPHWNTPSSGHLYSQGRTGAAIDGNGGYGYIPIGHPPTMNAPVVSSGGSLPVGNLYYTVTALVNQPGAETGVNTTPGEAIISTANSRVDLSWTAVSGATGYNIYRTTTSSADTSGQLLAANVQGTSYTDDGSVTPTSTLAPWHSDYPAGVNAPGVDLGSKVQKVVWDVSGYVVGSPGSFAVRVLAEQISLWGAGIEQRFVQSTVNSSLGQLNNGETMTPIAGSTMNGTWMLTLLSDGTLTVTSPDGTETTTNVSASQIANGGTWVNFALSDDTPTSWTGTPTRIKNIRLYKG